MAVARGPDGAAEAHELLIMDMSQFCGVFPRVRTAVVGRYRLRRIST